MGLCPSRNAASNLKIAQGKTYQPAAQTPPPQRPPPGLRADAAEFVPAPAKEATPKAAWELFLEQKREEQKQAPKKSQPFARRQDGTYTSDYRKLLDSTKTKRNPTLREVQAAAATGTVSEDMVRSWKDCAPRPKPTPVAKSKGKEPDALQAALRKARAMPKEQVLELLAEKTAVAADDSVASQPAHRHVPFGLTDRHYLSGEEDDAKSNVHRSLKATPQRDYVTSDVTAELEDTITEVLYKLRLLRTAEETTTGTSRRYCVGLREVARAFKQPGALKAILVAPDLEQNSGRGVDEKLQQLLETCKRSKTPVVFGLSRLRLGQAIKKNVTVSVLGIFDTRGVQGAFDRMVALS